MAWNWNADLEELEEALATFDTYRARTLVQRCIDHVQASEHAQPRDESKKLLRLLRRKRQFDLLSCAADALLQSPGADLSIRQDYAQAMLDRGMLEGARPYLEALVADAARAQESATVGVQARGLLGRLYKQRYVDAAQPLVRAHRDAMAKAIEQYLGVYLDSPTDPGRRWHGVNAVALAIRAQADVLPDLPDFEPDQIARELLQSVSTSASDAWDYAVGMEASLALDQHDAAVRWAQRYVAQDVDAFEVASTLRQLVEVWRLTPERSPGNRLLPLLESKLLSLDGGSVEPLSSVGHLAGLQARDGAGFERVFGEAGFVSLKWYRDGLQRARAVARIGRSEYHGAGTGFLARGEDLHPGWQGRRVLLTNSHVLARAGSPWLHGLEPTETRVSFSVAVDGGSDIHEASVSEVLWQSSPSEHDAVVVQLDNPPDVEPCPIQHSPIARNSKTQRVFIVGHPGGDALKFSLYNNRVLEQDARHVQYRAATDQGSSGSPVFDLGWRVLALHHRGKQELPHLDGRGVHAANEGVLLSAIVTSIERDLRGETQH